MFNHQKVGAVVVGAGKGERMGGIDKMFMPLEDRLVLSRTINVFELSPYVDQVVVVLNVGSLERGKRLLVDEKWQKVAHVVSGGLRRQDSVKAGLALLQDCCWVIIHDGARPLVPIELVETGLLAAQETGAAICAVPVVDTIKLADDNDFVIETLDRSRLWAVQTPQVFGFDIINQAHRLCANDATDDAAMVEQAGYRVKFYMGSYDNIKLTTPVDMDLAEALIRRRGR
jgi:2-C-methyl-D-erythritol 4-phosphate cytidylyltransferase